MTANPNGAKQNTAQNPRKRSATRNTAAESETAVERNLAAEVREALAYVPPPDYVLVPVADITITESAQKTVDGDAYYLHSMPAILHYYPGITRTEYWELTVAEHHILYEWLKADGGT